MLKYNKPRLASTGELHIHVVCCKPIHDVTIVSMTTTVIAEKLMS